MPNARHTPEIMAGETLGDLINIVRPWLSDTIVSPTNFDWIKQVCDGFTPTSGIIFERRLNDDLGAADLSLRFRPEDIRQGDLDCGHARELGGRLRRIIQGNSACRTFWLEFDNQRQGNAPVRPSIFFSVTDVHHNPDWSIDAVAILRDRPLNLATQKRLRQVWHALPQSSIPLQIGLMLARDTPMVRICAAMPRCELSSFLANVNLLHRLSAIDLKLDALCIGDTDDLRLHLDIGEDIGPVVSIELAPASDKAWSDHLKRLIGLGLCRDTEMAALQTWPGQDLAFAQLRPQDITLRPPTGSVARLALPIRTFNHSKLVFAADQSAYAKIYLYAGFCWPKPLNLSLTKDALYI